MYDTMRKHVQRPSCNQCIISYKDEQKFLGEIVQKRISIANGNDPFKNLSKQYLNIEKKTTSI